MADDSWFNKIEIDDLPLPKIKWEWPDGSMRPDPPPEVPKADPPKEEPAAPAVDPIEAFAARARAARVNGVAPRAPRLPLTPVVEAAPPRAVEKDTIIAVEEKTASTGALVFWHLPGNIRIESLTAAWAEEALDEKLLPGILSEKIALHRAVKSYVDAGEFATEHPDGGWVIVAEETVDTETKGKRTLDYKVGLRFTVEAGEKVRCEWPEGVTLEEGAAAEAAVAFEYAKYRGGEIASPDVSGWLVRMAVRDLGGVPLRASGGFYFIPAGKVETFEKIKRAVAKASSHTLYEIPAVHSLETIAAVLDAIRLEADKKLTDIANELEAGEIGKRGRRNRINDLDAIKVKVVGYEKLLGRPLGEVVARADELKKKLEESATRFELLETE